MTHIYFFSMYLISPLFLILLNFTQAFTAFAPATLKQTVKLFLQCQIFNTLFIGDKLFLTTYIFSCLKGILPQLLVRKLPIIHASTYKSRFSFILPSTHKDYFFSESNGIKATDFFAFRLILGIFLQQIILKLMWCLLNKCIFLRDFFPYGFYLSLMQLLLSHYLEISILQFQCL